MWTKVHTTGNPEPWNINVPLIDHPAGNYRFLPGIAPYSCGVVSCAGYEIVHVRIRVPIPYREGFQRIDDFLAQVKRPRAALCAIELRSPRPFSFAGFAAFNAEYAAILQDWGLFVDAVNPVARTNVAPEPMRVAEPSLYGFSYSRPTGSSQLPTFVVAGAGELPEGVLAPEFIVAAGDTSAFGMKTKAQFVMDLMENRLRGLGTDWPEVSDINVYTVHPFGGFLADGILGRVGNAGLHGVHWHYSRPPIDGIEFEMDLRGVRTRLDIP